jgi:tetratricopeptide (TPR) repeat protein
MEDHMGKDSKAMKQKGQLLSFVPTGEYYFTKGVKAFHRRDLKKAEKYFRRAMHLEPGEPMIVCQLAIVLSEMGEYQQSNRLLHLVLEELDENMAECHYFLANNYAHLGLFRDAFRHANLYLELNEDGEFAEDANDLLDLLTMEAEEMDEDYYEEDDLIVKQEEARNHLESGEFPKAIEIFQEVIEEYPEYWSAYNNLALAYFYLGEATKARDILNDVLERNPGNLHALCNALVFAHYQGQEKEGQDLKDSLEKIHPIHVEHQFKLGATFALVGEYELAYRWLKKLQKTGFEGDGAFYYWLAHASYFTGRENTAVSAWKKVLEFSPEKEGMEPWADKRDVKFESQVSAILNQLNSDYPEERLFALFLTSLSAKKKEILAADTSTDKMTEMEKSYLAYVSSGKLSGKEDEVKGAHETAKLLYDHHQPIGKNEAGVYIMWFSVFEQAAEAGYDFKNKKAWAAAVDYLWDKLRNIKTSKAAVAKKYGLSVSTLSKYINLANEFLQEEDSI